MIAQLKRKTMPGKLIESLILIGIALAVFFTQALPGLLLLRRGPAAEEDLTMSGLKGSYVTVPVNILYDTYAETRNSGGSVVSDEYVMPVYCSDGVCVIGLSLDSLPDIAQAKDVLNSTWAVLEGSAQELDGSCLTVTGTVREMDEQTEGYFRRVLANDGLDTANDLADGYLPLVLEKDRIGEHTMFGLVSLCILSAVLFLLGVLVAVRALTGYYQREIVNWYRSQPDPGAALYALNALYAGTQPWMHLRADRNFLMYDHGAASWVYPLQEVAWVYQTTTQHRTCGIPTGRTFSVTVWTTSGGKSKRHLIPSRSDSEANSILARLEPLLPYTVFGYSPRLKAMYSASPFTFVPQVRAEQAAAAAGSAPAAPSPAQK